jgi:hypothetical protein
MYYPLGAKRSVHAELVGRRHLQWFGEDKNNPSEFFAIRCGGSRGCVIDRNDALGSVHFGSSTTMRVRVLFIHQGGGRGGAGTMLANIIAAIDKGKFEPVVICPQGEGNAQLIEAGATIQVAERPLFQFLHYTGSSYMIFHPYFLRPAIMQRLHRDYWKERIRETRASIERTNP